MSEFARNEKHPLRDQLESFVHGTLMPSERQEVEAHVATCNSCCDILRSVPHDGLVERMRGSDISNALGETQIYARSSVETPTREETEIPPELADHSRYRIVKKFGEGGMGVVYQAEHRLMERTVALKVISRELVQNDMAVERFRLEVKAAARLSHRNIVTAFDAEQAGDLHFLVMEFIDGSSLSELVQRHGRLSVLRSCNYIMQAAHGLQHAFEKGMVHRDIKPQNLMRTPKGTIKILDFGLARLASQQNAPVEDPGLTGYGTTLGTPDYIAPEQARDSHRADIYSLGCTLYYLLSGRVPFLSGTPLDKIVSHCEHDPTPLSELRKDVPEEVIRIVERMMAKKPALRFQTPSEVVEALNPFGRPAAATAGKDLIDTTLAANTAKPAEQKTYMNLSPTLLPPERLDSFDVQQAESPLPPPRRPRKRRAKTTRSRRWLRRYRGPLITGSAVLLLLLVFVLLFPIVRDFVASVDEFSSTSGESSSSGEQPDSDGWIDLLSQIDTSRDTVTGKWHKTGKGLAVEPAEGAALCLRYTPPAEYDFEVTFTRETGSDSIALHFVAGNGKATFDIDAWRQHLVGIQNIDGRSMNDSPISVETKQLENGQTYTALVRVRRGKVDAFLDGKQLATYRGDSSNLSLIGLYALPDSRSLGLGVWESRTTFHKTRVRPAGDSSR